MGLDIFWRGPTLIGSFPKEVWFKVDRVYHVSWLVVGLGAWYNCHSSQGSCIRGHFGLFSFPLLIRSLCPVPWRAFPPSRDDADIDDVLQSLQRYIFITNTLVVSLDQEYPHDATTEEGVASEGKLLAPNSRRGKSRDCRLDSKLPSMIKIMMETMESMNNRPRALEQHRCSSLTGAQ